MLKEKSLYSEGLPVQVLTAHVEEYPSHFHEDLEVVYLLAGSVELKSGYYTYRLNKGDIFIVNGREIHGFRSTGERNMVMMLKLDMEYFSNYYETLKTAFFAVGEERGQAESMEVLRTTLTRIMREILQKGYGFEQKVIESAHNLLACLFSDFQCFLREEECGSVEGKGKGNRVLVGRMSRITDHMYANYSRKLTLNEIAEREHLSIYYLSHVIKEATGLSFQELLSFIRVDASEQLLLNTNKKIGAIAEETGFSAVRYYIKHFETWHGMHPLEYRKRFAGKGSVQKSNARCERSMPAEIEEMLQRRGKSTPSDYFSQDFSQAVIVDLDLGGEGALPKSSQPFPEEVFLLESMKPAARPFYLLKNLRETVVASGCSYLITAADKSPGNADSFSILVYNIPQELPAQVLRASSRDKVLELLKGCEAETEFLARLTGLSGTFRISRYRLSRENMLAAYEDGSRNTGGCGKRQNIINNWSTLPAIEFGRIIVSDTLSLRAALKGFSAELIFIDREREAEGSEKIDF